MSTSPLDAILSARSNGQCELCGSSAPLTGVAVPPDAGVDSDRHVHACELCAQQLPADAELDTKHWFCLQEAIWSEVEAVKVAAWRLLNRLQAESWAQDLLEQAYLEERTLAWAQTGQETSDGPKTLDSNGTELKDGDTVSLIRSLDVKGAGFTAKRGTVVKGIRLTGDPALIEGRVNKVGIFLKTCFLKKVG